MTQRAERFVGVAFLLLAAYVAVEAIRMLSNQEAPDASPVGIALTAVSIVVMLWLARAKRRSSSKSPTAVRLDEIAHA